MEDDGESFEINDRDLEYALDPTKRTRRKQTKEERIYGIWAEEEEEDDRLGLGSTSTTLTKGVSFVSGGITGQKSDQDVEQANDDDSEFKSKPGKRPKMDSGFGRIGLGQGFAGLRQSGPDWIQNSEKGSVILGMMKKMGYVEGKGLGANKQGMVDTVATAVRPGRGAIGAYGREASALGPKYGETSTKEEETKEPMVRKNGWRKDKKEKSKINYKTLDDVLADENDVETLSFSSTTMKIIDMTGPQQKIYNDFHTYVKKSKNNSEVLQNERKKFDIPELTQNLNLLLDVTEEEIKRNDRQIKLLKDQNKSLENDCMEIQKGLMDEKLELKKLETILNLLEEFSNNQNKDLNECKKLLLKLQKEYPEEYKIYGLETIALTNVVPMFKEFFNKWDPLKMTQLTYGMDLVKEWKDVLQNDGKHVFDRLRQEWPVFDRCLWEAWIPPIRQAIRRWDVKGKPHTVIDLLLEWIKVIPEWMTDYIMDDMIMPRIKEQVEFWTPTTDEIGIDTWLIPWHDILGHRLMSVYPTIRQKLAKDLKHWNPTDSSALGILTPWKDIFTKSSMSSFLSMNIIPKLEQALSSMNLEPNNSYLEFYAVLEWIDLIGPNMLSQILMKNFFPKWLNIFFIWLNNPGVVLSEVATYYKEWRNRFPSSLANISSIKSEFERALKLIGQAKQNLPIQLPPQQQNIHQNQSIHQPSLQFFNTPRINAIGSLKEYVELQATTHGLIFMPIVNRTTDKPTYQFGNIQIMFDRDVIIMYNPNMKRWEPITVETALELASH